MPQCNNTSKGETMHNGTFKLKVFDLKIHKTTAWLDLVILLSLRTLCHNKSDCLFYEILFVKKLKPSLNV